MQVPGPPESSPLPTAQQLAILTVIILLIVLIAVGVFSVLRRGRER